MHVDIVAVQRLSAPKPDIDTPSVCKAHCPAAPHAFDHLALGVGERFPAHDKFRPRERYAHLPRGERDSGRVAGNGGNAAGVPGPVFLLHPTDNARHVWTRHELGPWTTGAKTLPHRDNKRRHETMVLRFQPGVDRDGVGKPTFWWLAQLGVNQQIVHPGSRRQNPVIERMGTGEEVMGGEKYAGFECTGGEPVQGNKRTDGAIPGAATLGHEASRGAGALEIPGENPYRLSPTHDRLLPLKLVGGEVHAFPCELLEGTLHAMP